MANYTEPEERSLTNAYITDTSHMRGENSSLNISAYYENNESDYFQFTHATQTEKFLLDFIHVLDEFGVPILLIVGVLTNILLCITIRHSELKKVSTYSYFYALGIVDSLYLIVMAVPWLSPRLIDIYNMKGFCQLIYYLNILTTFLSSWYIVLLLFERLVVSYRPDTARKYFNAFRTKCYLTAVSIFAIVGHLYLTWTSGVFYFPQIKRQLCTVVQENYEDIIVMRKIDTVFAFILPVLLATLFLVPLLIYLCASSFKCTNGMLRVRTRMITVEVRLNSKRKKKRYSECPSCSSDRMRDVHKHRLLVISESRRLTIMTILLAFVYVILSLPHNVIKSKIAFLNGDYIVTPEDSTLLKLFEDLFNVNFVHKGIMYFLLLPEMRKNFLKLFCRCFKRNAKKEIIKENPEGKDKCIVTTL